MVAGDSIRDEVYKNIGDIFTYCVTSPSAKVNGDLKYKPGSCQLKFKMRAVASFNKIPGFTKISGYNIYNKMGPAMLTTKGHVLNILDRMVNTYDEWATTRETVLSESPAAAPDGLTKELLYVKMEPDSTRAQRKELSNGLLTTIEDKRIGLMDVKSITSDLEERMVLIEFFNATSSSICFILGAFQLVMTL